MLITMIEDKITTSRLELVKTKKELTSDIDWPVEELLR
jgi:hypothetical protein